MNTLGQSVAGTLGDHWVLTLIMIVVGLWIVFKYFAPQGWREWRNAGVLQAFVIALYVEMYGFPLTIYILTAFLGLDIPWLHLKGHLWATLLGLGEAGAMIEMFIGLSIVFVGVIFIIKGWKLIYRAQQKRELVQNGIYRYMRHPQYTGIYLIVIGQMIHWPTLPTLIIFPLIIWLYYHLAKKEERKLLDDFGEEYKVYMQEVPMFFPKLGDWGKAILSAFVRDPYKSQKEV